MAAAVRDRRRVAGVELLPQTVVVAAAQPTLGVVAVSDGGEL